MTIENKQEKVLIPKIIHYVWVGGQPLTPLAERCVASWRQFLPDYELRLWNEETIPSEVINHPYVRAMYAKKRWAFVSDYVRFWALAEYGGIYLDTDTEVLKSLSPLLSSRAFFGQTKDGVTAAGVIGAVSQHPAIKAMLAEYERGVTKDTVRTSPMIVTEVLATKNFPEVKVFDYRYFNPCDDGERCLPEKLSLAYTKNHWAESWVPYRRLRKVLRRVGLIGVIRKVKSWLKKN